VTTASEQLTNGVFYIRGTPDVTRAGCCGTALVLYRLDALLELPAIDIGDTDVSALARKARSNGASNTLGAADDKRCLASKSIRNKLGRWS
jgi:hypothetical protein